MRKQALYSKAQKKREDIAGGKKIMRAMNFEVVHRILKEHCGQNTKSEDATGKAIAKNKQLPRETFQTSKNKKKNARYQGKDCLNQYDLMLEMGMKQKKVFHKCIREKEGPLNNK